MFAAIPENISTWVIVTIVIAAFLAGFVDAVAGGGGLIQLPVMLVAMPTLPIATILGTNKSVAVIGTSIAANTYRKKIPADRRVLIPMLISAFVGSMVGAALVSNIDRKIFEPIVLVILMAVAIFTIFKPAFGQHELVKSDVAVIKAAVIGGGIGFYDGLIGPGTGTFLLFALVSVLGVTFLQASATAKFVNIATNLASIVVFLPFGHFIPMLFALMAPANLFGGFIGARTALDKGSNFVRAIFIVMILVLITRFITTLIG